MYTNIRDLWQHNKQNREVYVRSQRSNSIDWWLSLWNLRGIKDQIHSFLDNFGTLSIVFIFQFHIDYFAINLNVIDIEQCLFVFWIVF